jgi:guanine nucleotide-binding protein subunit alpha
MQLIHGSGYSSQERDSFKEIIFSNVAQSMKVILEAMDVLKIQLGNDANKKYASVILELPPQVRLILGAAYHSSVA